ncbi:MAG TPA: acyl-CoA dehydrogenase family protein [Chitinophagales bacterium]|nr:acyl-CoA dehydrogenase family protein [Chitinophagales bacterium]HMW12959.1 acyl-CoA dehydrogenase family protein [Chitinophagales bacterium]HMX59510.1 acyl-CoA dehydrogenase family protein [Chitinophagales bacterium]HMZ32758.1 acyl-CoA dehydrogenase family protein [Chitinophagales bacterium]HNA40079.1 acyl-CoA dehydrogenase family protein [Chitinophagales bacterium]
MKSLYFTEEHELFRQSVRQFVQKEILPYGDQWEKDEKIPRDLFLKLGEQGFLGINHEEAYGGSKADIFYTCAYLEELAKCGYAGVCAAVSVHQYMATNHLAEAGSHEIKEKFLRPSIEGKKVGAIAVTEPFGGSDVQGMRTTAQKDGEHYIINGSKTFITNGHFCDFVVVACKTDSNAGINGISLIIVERDTPGFTSSQLKKIGWHSSDTGELAFDNVKVPVSNLIGKEGMGFFYIMESFQIERLVAGIIGIGGGDHCLEETLKYMNEREAFGRPIKKFQVLRHEIVQLYTELEAGKQMTYNTCWLMQNGEVPVKEASMVKLYMTELGNKIVDKCLQMFGGYGYMEDFPIARAYRDARVGTIVGGTTQIMREILSKIIIDDIRYKKVYSNDSSVAAASNSNSTNNEKSWGNPSTAKEIIASIPLRIKKEKAADYSTTFQFDIAGETGGQYTLFVNKGDAKIEAGLNGTPECIITADAKVYEDIELGRMDPTVAFMGGQIKVTNIGAMMQFAKYFHRIQ